ncbi:MAG: (2Fe-2S)-binding protein [Defluviitaleaceae bacterium]|nr:(2Fe-2S)-binding protein [Defluviitaleaceae bacterium]
MRISLHPILDFQRGAALTFTFNGTPVSAYTGETIAAALYAAGYRTLANSPIRHRPRGLYCAIGNCSSCMMVVNGKANVKTCIELVRDGMVVETQQGKGTI